MLAMNTHLDATLLQELAMVGLPMDTPIPQTPSSGFESKERPRKRTLIACDLCKVRHIKVCEDNFIKF
jgi:hypothetical protein